MRVLLVGDGPSVEAVRLGLGAGGDYVQVGEDEDEGLDLARHYGFDVAVLFSGGGSEIEVARLTRGLRAAGVPVPVMAVLDWSCDDVGRRVAAFAAGADDVVTARMHREEFEARLTALARRGKGHPAPTIEVGALSIDLPARTVRAGGRYVGVTGQEFRLLEVLALNKNRAVGRDTLLDALYGGLDEPEAKIIDVFVCKIRRKLEAALAGAAGEACLETVWGLGYRLTDQPRPVAVHAYQMPERGKIRAMADRIEAALGGQAMAFEPLRRSLAVDVRPLRQVLCLMMQTGHVRNIGGRRAGGAIYALAERVAA